MFSKIKRRIRRIFGKDFANTEGYLKWESQFVLYFKLNLNLKSLFGFNLWKLNASFFYLVDPIRNSNPNPVPNSNNLNLKLDILPTYGMVINYDPNLPSYESIV